MHEPRIPAVLSLAEHFSPVLIGLVIAVIALIAVSLPAISRKVFEET